MLFTLAISRIARHRREHVILQPLAVGEHALLVIARTEVASLARIRQQVVMATLIAENARESFMQVTAVEKALEDLGLYRRGLRPKLAIQRRFDLSCPVSSRIATESLRIQVFSLLCSARPE